MAGERILIVEDNERNIKLLRDVLGAHGYRTIEARSGEDAVALGRKERPELVLMDIQLPGMDGLAALRELRKLAETAATPVVAVTAFAMKDDRERLLAAGFDGYMEKPIDIRELPARVSSYLASTPGVQEIQG
jgi:CheY-like chemotaxis protein